MHSHSGIGVHQRFGDCAGPSLRSRRIAGKRGSRTEEGDKCRSCSCEAHLERESVVLFLVELFYKWSALKYMLKRIESVR